MSSTSLYILERLTTTKASQSRYDAVIVLTGMVDLSKSTPEHLEFGSAVDRILKGIELVKIGKAKYHLTNA